MRRPLRGAGDSFPEGGGVTPEGNQAWEDELWSIEDSLWNRALSEMRHRRSVRLDAEDVREARRSLYPSGKQRWYIRALRILSVFAVVVAGVALKISIDLQIEESAKYVMISLIGIVIFVMILLQETVLRR